MKVEYLLILKGEDKFCNNISSLKKFLTVDDELSIKGKDLNYKKPNSDSFVCGFAVSTGELEMKKERYFKIKLESDTANTTDLSSLCRKVKKILSKINPENFRINTLWNDIGRNYALEAYPLINEVENLMRKLLTEFLLINVGMDWSKTAIHNELQTKIEGNTSDNNKRKDELHYTDFIQLSHVLFKKYRNTNITEVDNIIQKAKKEKVESIPTKSLEKILPMSNWERYFKSLIEYDEDKLQTKWATLHKLRNHVAHNRFLEKSEFEQIQKLHKELIELFSKTLDNLDKIQIKKEDKEETLGIYTKSFNATEELNKKVTEELQLYRQLKKIFKHQTEIYHAPITSNNPIVLKTKNINSYRLVKVAKDLNIGTKMIVEYLNSLGFSVNNKPTAIIKK